jgi:hypothetical protein
MVGLLDIAPIPERVDIGGNAIDVTGVSVEGIAHLLQRFPQFAQLQALMGGGGDKDLATVLFSLGPQVIAGIIAAGCGYPGNDDAIKRALALDLQAQADLLDAVLRKTLTKGLDPFVARLESIRATLMPPMTLADKINEVKKKNSRKPSNLSSDGLDMQPPMSGA